MESGSEADAVERERKTEIEGRANLDCHTLPCLSLHSEGGGGDIAVGGHSCVFPRPSALHSESPRVPVEVQLRDKECLTSHTR